MNMVSIRVDSLDSRTFEPFGTVLESGRVRPYYSEPGLDFWYGIDEIQTEKGNSQLSWLDIKEQRPFLCSQMEYHNNCSTTIIPMKGKSIILFGLSKESCVDKSLPDPDTFKAFRFDGTRGVNLKPGVWFWNRYPLTPSASYIFILGKDFNTDIIDLKQKLGITIKLEMV